MSFTIFFKYKLFKNRDFDEILSGLPLSSQVYSCSLEKKTAFNNSI